MKDQRIFWDWFRANEHKYRNVEVPEKERLLDEILGALHTYSYEGITFCPDSTWFLPIRADSDPTALGIRIAYGHFDESRRGDFLAGTYIMLECALGELALAERIQQIEVTFLPSSPETGGYYPVTELQDYLDRRISNDS